ncbi:MAG: MBL fold metallo-hydrolase [Rhizobiales bacterium]|nr:MBL fold metallo-hydrolase [Hyphomicrobiales bacterium]
MRVRVLGCGTSSGVPMIGCHCAVCSSDDPRNQRRRCAITIQSRETTILVDTPPELRLQCVEAGIDWIDAVLYTHAHADHVNGIDDLRSLNNAMDRRIDAYADARVLEKIRSRFDYAFQAPDPARGWFRPCLKPTAMDGPFLVGDLLVRPIEQRHGNGPSWGFRVGDVAYSTDTDGLSEQALGSLENLDLWIVDCLRENPHPSHAHLEMTLGWIERLKPKRTILTHMSHELDFSDLAAKLPDGVEPAVDGMVIDLGWPHGRKERFAPPLCG